MNKQHLVNSKSVFVFNALTLALWVPGYATAQESATLPVVVVYGEKTERTLQETSSSVRVFDEDDIKAVNANEARDLLRLTPNIVDTGFGNTVPTVRGIDGAGPGKGAMAFLTGTRPRLNVSVDGRSLTYNELAFGPQSMWDMEQAEIYLGPQSYIQGRNSIAGAMILKSKAPSYEWESAAKVGLANQDYVQTAAMLSGALVEDQIAFRLSADSQYRESTQDLATFEPAGDSKEVKSNAFRGKLLFEPKGLPGLTSTLTVAHYDSRSPQGENVPNDAFRARYDKNRPVFETESDSGIWDIHYQASEQVELGLNTVYSNFDIDRIALPGGVSARIDGEEFQIEPSVRYTSKDERLRALAGLRFYTNEQLEQVEMMGQYIDETTTASAYLEVFYALSPSLDLTMTGRYETEDRYRKGGNLVNRGGRQIDFQVGLDKTYSDFLPKVALAWKADQNNTYGISIAKGFRAGGAGVNFNNGTGYEFDEEKVWNYELFTRHRLQGGLIELTSNLFYNQYDDLQLPDGQDIINVGKSITYGAEAGVNWLATEDVLLFANLGVLESDITDSPQSDYQGNELPMAPALTAASGVRYWYGDFEFGANIRYTGKYFSYFDNDPEGEVGSFATTNLQASYLFDHGQVTLFANNAFDADSATFYDKDNRGATDKQSPIMLQPKMVGVSVEMNF